MATLVQNGCKRICCWPSWSRGGMGAVALAQAQTTRGWGWEVPQSRKDQNSKNPKCISTEYLGIAFEQSQSWKMVSQTIPKLGTISAHFFFQSLVVLCDLCFCQNCLYHILLLSSFYLRSLPASLNFTNFSNSAIWYVRRSSEFSELLPMNKGQKRADK